MHRSQKITFYRNSVQKRTISTDASKKLQCLYLVWDFKSELLLLFTQQKYMNCLFYSIPTINYTLVPLLNDKVIINQ